MINRVNQPKRVTCSMDSGSGWKHLSEPHKSATADSRNAEEWAVTGKSIGNVIKSSELRSILLEKYLSAVRCILLMDGFNGFQRQDEIGNLFKKRRSKHTSEKGQCYLIVDVYINCDSPVFNAKNISAEEKQILKPSMLSRFN